jgi:hypothetical protein
MKELVRVRVQYASKGSRAVRPTNGLYLYLFILPVLFKECQTRKKMTLIFYVTIIKLKTNFLRTNYAHVRNCNYFSKLHRIYCCAYLWVTNLSFVYNLDECQFCPHNFVSICQHQRYAVVLFAGALRYNLASCMWRLCSYPGNPNPLVPQRPVQDCKSIASPVSIIPSLLQTYLHFIKSTSGWCLESLKNIDGLPYIAERWSRKRRVS